jgi:hypothetical protein
MYVKTVPPNAETLRIKIFVCGQSPDHVPHLTQTVHLYMYTEIGFCCVIIGIVFRLRIAIVMSATGPGIYPYFLLTTLPKRWGHAVA